MKKVIIEPNNEGKYTAKIGGVIVGKGFHSIKSACSAVTKYIKEFGE